MLKCGNLRSPRQHLFPAHVSASPVRQVWACCSPCLSGPESSPSGACCWGLPPPSPSPPRWRLSFGDSAVADRSHCASAARIWPSFLSSFLSIQRLSGPSKSSPGSGQPWWNGTRALFRKGCREHTGQVSVGEKKKKVRVCIPGRSLASGRASERVGKDPVWGL